jgi:hypothetical protein
MYPREITARATKTTSIESNTARQRPDMRIYNHSGEKSGAAMRLPLPYEGPARIGAGPHVQVGTRLGNSEL